MWEQEYTSRDHRQHDGDWLPVVGDVVCVHSSPEHNYFAKVLAFVDSAHEIYRCVRLQPLYSPRTNAREMHARYLKPVIITFQGYACVQCKGRIQ